jgi:hypothetical protein
MLIRDMLGLMPNKIVVLECDIWRHDAYDWRLKIEEG